MKKALRYRSNIANRKKPTHWVAVILGTDTATSRHRRDAIRL